MSRVRSTRGALLALVAGCVAATMPRAAHAIVGGGYGLASNASKFLYGVCDPLGGTTWTCHKVVIRVDPKGDVTHVTMTLDYDLFGPQFIYSPLESGPLDVFSVGGSAPPATPGAGVQPFPIFTTVQDTPGAPLPGSTLSVVDNGLAVTVDYLLATPVNVTTETNFFLFVFDFITPITIDASLSTVTYSTLALPGADFTETAFSCTSGDPLYPTCGSTVPAVSITLNPALVPEPSVAVLVGSGVVLVAGLRRRWNA